MAEPAVLPDYWRQQDIAPPERLTFPITIIGAGGIGSPLALALAKMGCRKLVLYDPDIVEPHNLPNQVYRLQDAGSPKVEALKALLEEFSTTTVDITQERVGSRRLQGLVISAVDSMSSRTQIWNECVRFNGSVPLYIDARMGGEVCRLLAVSPVDPDDVRAYEETLFTDEAAAEEACTAQAIIYNTFGIAALAANQVKRYAMGETVERDLMFDFATLSLLKGGQLFG